MSVIALCNNNQINKPSHENMVYQELRKDDPQVSKYFVKNETFRTWLKTVDCLRVHFNNQEEYIIEKYTCERKCLRNTMMIIVTNRIKIHKDFYSYSKFTYRQNGLQDIEYFKTTGMSGHSDSLFAYDSPQPTSAKTPGEIKMLLTTLNANLAKGSKEKSQIDDLIKFFN